MFARQLVDRNLRHTARYLRGTRRRNPGRRRGVRDDGRCRQDRDFGVAGRAAARKDSDQQQQARSPAGHFLIPVESLTAFFTRLYSGQPMPPSARRYLRRIANPKNS